MVIGGKHGQEGAKRYEKLSTIFSAEVALRANRWSWSLPKERYGLTEGERAVQHERPVVVLLARLALASVSLRNPRRMSGVKLVVFLLIISSGFADNKSGGRKNPGRRHQRTEEEVEK